MHAIFDRDRVQTCYYREIHSLGIWRTPKRFNRKPTLRKDVLEDSALSKRSGDADHLIRAQTEQSKTDERCSARSACTPKMATFKGYPI